MSRLAQLLALIRSLRLSLSGQTLPGPDTSPPTIVLSTVPSNFDAPGPLTLIAGVSDDRNYIARVELRKDGGLIDTKYSAPFEWYFAVGPGDSTRTYEVKAFDGAGNQGSDAKTVTVNIAPPATVTVDSISGATVTLALNSWQPGDQLDWGDGTVVAAAASLSHTYGASGTRTAQLLRGGVAGASVMVTVTVTPPPAFTPYVSFPSGRSAARNRNPDTIPWEPARTIDQASVNRGDWGPLVTLSDGSQGVRIEDRHFRTDTPGQNALRLSTDLQVAVELRRCSEFSYGLPGYLASANIGAEAGTDLRAYDNLFLSGRPPAGFDGASPARAIAADSMKNLIVDGFESYRGAGFYWDGWQGGAAQVCHVRNGGLYDVDGRRVDAAGQWRTSSVAAEYFATCQAMQLNNAAGVENFVWELFEVINDPLYGAMFEDALSAHASSGTVASNICWRDYLIENCLPYDGGVFAASGGAAARYGRGPDGQVRAHSGTGGLAGDGGAPHGGTRTADTIAGRILAERFTVLTSYNAFTGISAGNRSTLADYLTYGVRAFRSAAPAGYTLLETSFVGTQLIDYQSDYDPALWFGHVIRGGQVGVFVPNPDGTLGSGTSSNATATSRRDQVVNGSYLMASNGPDDAISGLDTITGLPNPGTVLAGLERIDQLRAARRADIMSRGGVLGVRA